MPVGPTDSRRAFLIALAGLVTAVGIGALILVVAGSGGGGSGGGGDFSGLRVDTLIAAQERDGVPFCVNDPATGSRPICIFHTGDDPAEGWVAYDAQTEGCALDFDVEGDVLVGCDGTEYPYSGDGLPQYPVTVADGRLSVALDGEDDDEPTTTSTILVTGD